MSRLEGKVAIITGGAQGQGEATARLFAQEGATVIISDILSDKGAAVAQSIGGKAQFRSQDVRSEHDWRDLVADIVANHGRIDILVNNAGLNFLMPVTETTAEDMHRILAINVVGPYLGIKAVVPQMRKQGSGSIINISSVNGLRANNDLSAYDASKWALRGLSKSLAIELGASGIRVNSVHPGAIDTAMINQEGTIDSSAMAKAFNIPLGRIAQPVEVARASLFLASDEASYITGAELAVDGAWSAGVHIDWESLNFA